MTDPDDGLRTLVADLHAHLEATAEMPVEESASRWLGEAEAVCADAVGPEIPLPVVEKRVGQVRMLLSNVDGTGHPEADDHVAAARELAERIDARL